jgi:hypothetical protein
MEYGKNVKKKNIMFSINSGGNIKISCIRGSRQFHGVHAVSLYLVVSKALQGNTCNLTGRGSESRLSRLDRGATTSTVDLGYC